MSVGVARHFDFETRGDEVCSHAVDRIAGIIEWKLKARSEIVCFPTRGNGPPMRLQTDLEIERILI